jgi:hypothetical protein
MSAFHPKLTPKQADPMVEKIIEEATAARVSGGALSGRGPMEAIVAKTTAVRAPEATEAANVCSPRIAAATGSNPLQTLD